MSTNLWRKIFETASDPELQFILHESDLTIPGFRADKRKTIPRFLILKTMIQTINSEQKKTKCYANKIREAYDKLLDDDSKYSSLIEGEDRRKIIGLVLRGEPEAIKEAEEMTSQHTSQMQKKHEDVTEDNGLDNDVEKDEWKKESKKLEREMKRKIENLEQKYEHKVHEVSELKRNIGILEKKHLMEVNALHERLSRIEEESKLYQKKTEELQQKAISLDNEVNAKEKKIEELLSTVDSLERGKEEYYRQAENEKLEIMPIEHQEVEEDNNSLTKNRTKILVIGDKLQKQVNLKNFDLEFVHTKNIDENDLLERSDVSEKVILLSWTMTMAMQRKIKKIVSKSKLNEFYDYNTFCKYISEEENLSYASK